MAQSEIKFLDDKVIKTYYKDKKNWMSSVDNEIYCIQKFSDKGKNPYSPNILDYNINGYTIERYDFSLGTTKEISNPSIRRLLFSCSVSEILHQLEEIEKILKSKNIWHKDINPGNLLFSEKDLKLKLIDFYWAETDHIKSVTPPKINPIYSRTNDLKAFLKIKEQISKIDKIVRKQVVKLKRSTLPNLGKIYYDGSSKRIGRTYHKLDIPYFKEVTFHKDNTKEFKDITKNMTKPIRSIIDVGCASCYHLFNFMRMFRLEKAIGYESDPVMLNLLRGIKEIFNLSELEIKSGVKTNTVFEKFDLCLCLNVHMWLEKQCKLGANKIISNLIENSKEMFFQTAGKESRGSYIVKNLKSNEEIKKYLESLGKKEVNLISTTKKHGGKRHLFRIR